MEINLLPKKQSKYPPALFFWILIVLSLLIAGGLFWQNHNKLIQEQQKLQQQLKQLSQQQSVLEAQRNAVDPRFQKLKQFQSELEKIKDDQTDWKARLNDLTLSMPKDAVINSISYQAPDISIDGKIDSLKTAAQFSETLKKLAWVQDVSLTTVANANKNGSSATQNSNLGQVVSGIPLNDSFHMTIHTKDTAITNQQKGAQK